MPLLQTRRALQLVGYGMGTLKSQCGVALSRRLLRVDISACEIIISKQDHSPYLLAGSASSAESTMSLIHLAEAQATNFQRPYVTLANQYWRWNFRIGPSGPKLKFHSELTVLLHRIVQTIHCIQQIIFFSSSLLRLCVITTSTSGQRVGSQITRFDFRC